MKVLLENNNEIRHKDTLELLGYWFKIDNITYYIPLA